MANTYTNVNLHIIFAVKNTNSLLPAIYLPRLYAYMAGILTRQGHYVHAIGGIDSHVHILIGYSVCQPIPDMMRDLKAATSRFINESRIIPYRFEWQKGYGCFSYSRSQIGQVAEYIRHQHEHHKNITLEQEMTRILDRAAVEYDCRYILRDPQ